MSLGATIEMMDKIRYNRNLLKKSRRFNEEKKELGAHGEIPSLKIKATSEQLEAIREKLARQKEKNRTTSLLVLLASLVIAFFIFQFLIVGIFFSYFFN